MAHEVSLPTGIKVVYIAGRFRATNANGTQDMMQVQRNIMKAMDASLEVWKRGHAALCPHSNTMFFTGADGCDDHVWLTGDIELMRRCDAVWAIEGWEQSFGAKQEVEIAKALGIPVFTSLKQVEKWLSSPQA